jgi:hypothetical protein
MNANKFFPRKFYSSLFAALLVLGVVSTPVLAKQKIAGEQALVNSQSEDLLKRISGDAMRGHLSFLASDLLEGRGTPSRGLDLAAEYIAAQFRMAGLEAVGDDGYFQTADWNKVKPPVRRNPNAASAVQETETATSTNLVPVKVRNVIGVLHGSDPVLRDTYVLVTAHYDHLGIKDGKIFNGANDNGSGTVSVIELAKAFASMKSKPKRSIVFMTFFGEEKGLVGSRYYGKNPIFPLSKTVAGINLEQVGRTDDSEGVQIASAGITGFDFSEVGDIIVKAGVATDIKIWKHPVNSDRYFGASDNQALADQGVPAHTVSVAYGFPDYHAPNDDWEKIDYANMEKVDRAIALAVLNIANNPIEPKWNASNPKAAKYLKAWEMQQKTK